MRNQATVAQASSLPVSNPDRARAQSGNRFGRENDVISDSTTNLGVMPVQQPAGPAPAAAPRDPHHSCTQWMEPPAAAKGLRLRVGLVLGFIILLYAGLSVRLVQIQVLQASMWKSRGSKQQVFKELIAAPRGSVSTSDLLPLAYCVPRETIIADLFLLKEQSAREAAAKAVAPLLKLQSQTLLSKMTRDDRRIVYLARNIEEATADKIRALKIRGIGFEDSFVRTYPQGSLFAQGLGWAGADAGMDGLELELNGILSGTPGYLRYYRDAARRLIALNDGAIGPADNHPPRDGLAVTLTIEARIQQTAEEELARIHEQYQPKSATCIVMDVSTGAILAMACTPSYDPNFPSKSPDENRRNRTICDIYEPGSTFKTFSAAMALERKLWRRNEMINCENGAWRIGYRTLHDSHAYGLLSFDDVLSKSSNIGAAKIAQRLGLQGLYDAVTAFGFGHETGVNLPGEVRGKVRPRKSWSNDSIYSVAMGHEIGVTPIQLVAAYAAVVNGGVLYRPKIVQKILNDKGEELYTLHAQAQRRVISEETSQQMRDVLARVVSPGGTGMKAFCTEWQIGGKTGTTKKWDHTIKAYSDTKYIASFCGFAPVNNPRLVCLVTVDEPAKGTGYYGGTVASPAVREVLRKGMTVLNVPARSVDEQRKILAEARAVPAHP